MTIEDLARMVTKGFDESKAHTDQRFTELKSHMDQQFAAIRKQLTGVVYRREFEDLEKRAKDLENMLAMPSRRKTAA